MDASSQADQIPCFSNSASNLTLLAPGVLINAGAITLSGTSQAAPHVAGAVAVLRSTYPNESLDQIKARMTSTGMKITDPRNNITIPRLNLLAAAIPTNDMFTNRITLSGLSGSTSGTNVLASKEDGEPIIAGNFGGESLWWKWIAPQSGQLTINTNGSGFDSLLGIYTGSQLSNLIPITSLDNSASPISQQANLILEVIAGTEYAFSLDVANGAPSSFALNWNLNTNPNANISSKITGNSNVNVGSTLTYTLTVTNNGPQTATNVITSLTAPVGATISPSSTSCSVTNNVMSCAIGSLHNGGISTFVFDITWNAINQASMLSSTVTSDTPINGSLFSTTTIQISAINTHNIDQSNTLPSNLDSADIPTLPQWGIIMLVLTMLLINYKISNTKKGQE